MRLRDAAIDAVDAPHAGGDPPSARRARTQAQEQQGDSALRAMLRDAGQRIVNQRGGGEAGVQQNDVVERIFENDEIGRRLAAPLRLDEPREAIE